MMINGQRAVEVDRLRLIEQMKENRKKHVEEYEAAMMVYRKAIVEYLKDQVALAEAGQDVNHTLQIARPESHEEDYSEAILMLEWSVSEHVRLDGREFARYVQNNWEWSEAFIANTRAYVVGAPRP